MRGVIPVVSFRPEGHDKFMALMALMVGVNVDLTYIVERTRFGLRTDVSEKYWSVESRKGEILAVTERYIMLRPYGLPKRYHDSTHYWQFEWERVKMIEVME